MTITPERLAAYVDGELSEFEERLVEHELARSPALRAQLDAHRALKARLAARSSPGARSQVAGRLVRKVHRSRRSAQIIDLQQVRAARRPPRKTTRWTWLLAPLLAA